MRTFTSTQSGHLEFLPYFIPAAPQHHFCGNVRITSVVDHICFCFLSSTSPLFFWGDGGMGVEDNSLFCFGLLLFVTQFESMDK